MSLEEIIAGLRFPAGKHYSLEMIKQDTGKFVVAFHQGLKKLHMSLISDMMMLENTKELLIKDTKKRDVPKDKLREAIETIDRILCASRRANDSIAWIMLGPDPNSIKRLCYRNPRGNLKDQNPDSVIETLNVLNSDPFKLAIWTDATTSIDVGDILLRDMKNGKISCIELKDGKINRTIFSFLKAGSIHDAEMFLEEYGKKGAVQLERVISQATKYGQSMEILKENKGTDPISKLQIHVTEIPTRIEYYHQELNGLIDRARAEGTSINCIDDCLWVYATSTQTSTADNAIRDFSEKVVSVEKDMLKNWLRDFSESGDYMTLFPIFILNENANVPECLPIYLFGISEQNVYDLIMEKINVLLFINWPKFAEIFERSGLSLSWSSKKDGRRELSKPKRNRAFVVGDRIPIIAKDDDWLRVGPGIIMSILYEGKKPTCFVEAILESFKLDTNKVSMH